MVAAKGDEKPGLAQLVAPFVVQAVEGPIRGPLVQSRDMIEERPDLGAGDLAGPGQAVGQLERRRGGRFR